MEKSSVIHETIDFGLLVFFIAGPIFRIADIATSHLMLAIAGIATTFMVFFWVVASVLFAISEMSYSQVLKIYLGCIASTWCVIFLFLVNA